jgi:Spy/CpxP family protein refolding chaperone
MKLSIRRLITVASVVGGLAVLSAGTALADDAQPQQHAHIHAMKHAGILQQAQKLDGVSAEQIQQIGALEAQRHAAAEPVRQVDAKLLTDLATQVDAAKVDRGALQPELTAEEQAAQAEKNADAATLTSLHALLTPAQRNQLVDRVEAVSAKSEQRRQALESFRGDSFDASALVHVRIPGDRTVRIAEQKVPQMTAEQRAHFAAHLRARAAHDSKG